MMDLAEFPGSELILPGIEDLRDGRSDTTGALLIAIASTRLTKAGLDFPKHHLKQDPELTLYSQLQHEREDAYPYYNALLSSLNSFCNALELDRESVREMRWQEAIVHPIKANRHNNIR